MAADASEATLELTILSADGLKDSAFLGKSRPFAVAWLDPSLKKSTKSLINSSRIQKLHLPLSPRALQNPSSCLTIQILTSRLPFRATKLIGTAVLPLSSVHLAGDILTLQLRKPSGRAHGALRVSVRVLWCLGAAVLPVDCMRPDFPDVDPSAPPMPDGYRGSPDFLCVDATLDSIAPRVSDGYSCHDFPHVDSADGNRGPDCLHLEPIAPKMQEEDHIAQPMPDGRSQRAWRSFLIGLASGSLAAVLVGVAGFSEG